MVAQKKMRLIIAATFTLSLLTAHAEDPTPPSYCTNPSGNSGDVRDRLGTGPNGYLVKNYAICDGPWRLGINEGGVYGLWNGDSLLKEYETEAEKLVVTKYDDGQSRTLSISVYDTMDVVWELKCSNQLVTAPDARLVIDASTNVVKFTTGPQNKLWLVKSDASVEDEVSENCCLSGDKVPANQQCCPSNDNGQCDMQPINPYSCGPNYSCYYEKECLAKAAKWNIVKDCCQSPLPSACPLSFDPLVCGSKECPYDNSCLAKLAGYDPTSQCTSATQPIPTKPPVTKPPTEGPGKEPTPAPVDPSPVYSCEDDNPCTPDAALGKYFAATDPDYFIQCGPAGTCYEMPCAPGTKWDQEFYLNTGGSGCVSKGHDFYMSLLCKGLGRPDLCEGDGR